MQEDEDPKEFFLSLDEKRNELALLGKAIGDDDVLTIILGQLPPFYDRVKYQSESQEDFNLEEAMIVMRNMHTNRVEEEGRLLCNGGIYCEILYLLQKDHEESNCFKKNKKPAGNSRRQQRRLVHSPQNISIRQFQLP